MSPTRKSAKPLAVYTRVSVQGSRSDDELLSHDLQRKRIKEYAETHGLKVAGRFEDTDVSGARMRRAGLDAALAAIEAGEYGGIIVARLTRFARSLEGGLRVIRQIHRERGDFVACDAEFDTTTPNGKAYLQIMLVIAELELETIKSYAEEVRRSKVEAGHYVSGAPPAGYSKEIVGHRKEGKPIYGGLVPNEHAPAIKKAFKLRANGGSWKEISQHLTAAGVPTSRGNTVWSYNAARLLLHNKAYIGEIGNGGVRKVDDDGNEYITAEHVNKGAHKPLVDLLLFESVQAKRERARPKGDVEDALLRGLLRCGTCGNRLHRDHMNRKPDGKRGGTDEKVEFYRCRNDGACNRKVMITRKLLDPYVTNAALKHLGDFEYTRVRGEEVDISALENEVRRADVELADLTARLKTGTVSAEMAVALTQALETRRDEAKAALRESPAEEILRTVIYWTPEELIETFETKMTMPERRKLLGALIEKVTVQAGRGNLDERIEIEFTSLDLARLGVRRAAFTEEDAA